MKLFTTRFSSPSSWLSPRSLAIASNSSRKRTQGVFAAKSKSARMFFDVLPRNEEIKTIKTRNVQLKAQLLGDVPSETALSRSGRPVHQETQRCGEVMNVGLPIALCDTQEFVDGVPLVLVEYDRMLGKRFEIHLFYERESAIFIDRKNLRKRRSSGTELLITLFEHLA